MPTLTFADGTTLVFEITATAVPPVVVTSEPPLTDVGMTATLVEPQVSESDVKAALAKVPPKWSATAWRFVKTLIAGMVAAFGVAWASTGGTIEGVLRDPQTFLVALGTAVLMAGHKALTWKE